MPYFDGGKPVTPTGSWAISINPHSERIDAARKFAEFVSLNPEGAFLSVSANPLPPVNAEAYKQYAERMAGMTDKIGPVIDIITYETQNTAVGRPRTVGFVTFETVMNKAFSDIRNGAEVEGRARRRAGPAGAPARPHPVAPRRRGARALRRSLRGRMSPARASWPRSASSPRR